MICVLLWAPILYVVALLLCTHHNTSNALFVTSCIEKEAGLSPSKVSAECRDAVATYLREAQDSADLNVTRWFAFECATSPIIVDPQCQRVFVMDGKQYIEYLSFGGSTLVSVSWDENDHFDPPSMEVEGPDHLEKASETRRE
jgi:hypothetical protein